MPDSDRLITVAVHTFDKAVSLKQRLENAGIPAILQNINLEHPVVSSGIRIRIHESDLPKALLLIEGEPDQKESSPNFGEKKEILVPVDFSDYSFEACSVAIRLAASHSASVVILHSYIVQQSAGMQLSDALTYENSSTDIQKESEVNAERMLRLLMDKIRANVSLGILPEVELESRIMEGLPEETILQYSRDHSPILIVMGTRGADKKERELIGSVTAEVLDSCRYPVLTIPEGIKTENFFKAESVLFFCNGEQTDILALQHLLEFLDKRVEKITLALMISKKSLMSERRNSLVSLAGYCREHYPMCEFSTAEIPVKEAEAMGKKLHKKFSADLIVVPNKRKSAFARLFNPGLAHRLLFRADIPMMVLPV